MLCIVAVRVAVPAFALTKTAVIGYVISCIWFHAFANYVAFPRCMLLLVVYSSGLHLKGSCRNSTVTALSLCCQLIVQWQQLECSSSKPLSMR
jgi:hypothetical protein